MKMALLRKSRFATDNFGGVMVEMAFVLPALLLLSFGCIELGRLFWTITSLTRATEAAARCGALDQVNCPYATVSTIQAYAVKQAWGVSNLKSTNFTVTTPANCNGKDAQPSVKVTASYNFNFYIPYFTGVNPLPINPAACYATLY
jgi:Flp pilus assembly protein TadG